MCALSLRESPRENSQEFKDRQTQLQREHSNQYTKAYDNQNKTYQTPTARAESLTNCHESLSGRPPWEHGSELDAGDGMEDEYPEGEGVDIQTHHLPGIQAIVGDQLTLHPSSIFPRTSAEIDQAAAMLQSSEPPDDSREAQARTGLLGGRVSPSPAEESRGQTFTRVFNHREPSTFCATEPREKKRRRLNNRDPISGKDYRS